MNTEMKKLTAVLAALVMVFAMTAALSEGSAFAFRNGVKFGMSVNEVRAAESGQGELDHEHEGLGFDELECLSLNL